MGAIQNSVNALIGTTSAALLAGAKFAEDKVKIAKEGATESMNYMDKQDKSDIAEQKTKTDEAELQKKLANMELSNPSESNTSPIIDRVSAANDARKAFESSKKALKNMKLNARVRKGIREITKAQIARLSSANSGLIGDLKTLKVAKRVAKGESSLKNIKINEEAD